MFVRNEEKEIVVDNTDKLINKVYIHINNGGVDILAREEEYTSDISGEYHKYIKLELEASHMGQITNKISLGVTKDTLKLISEYFKQQYDNLEETDNIKNSCLAYKGEANYNTL